VLDPLDTSIFSHSVPLKQSQRILEKSSKTKFCENPSIESRVVPDGTTDTQTDGRTDGQRNLTKLGFTFRNISKPHVGKDIYREIQKDGLNFVLLYFLNYTWYVNDLHNI